MMHMRTRGEKSALAKHIEIFIWLSGGGFSLISCLRIRSLSLKMLHSPNDSDLCRLLWP